jgi:hypothetical protein
MKIFEQKKITLGTISGIPFHTGSTFLVEYSYDCVNYETVTPKDFEVPFVELFGGYVSSSLLSWNTVYLPQAGATASVIIPTGSACMRLTDLEFPESTYIQTL